MSPESPGSVIVTGGTGFVGSHLRSALAEEGLRVTVLARDESRVSAHDNERVERGDVTAPSTLGPLTDDVAVHLAAQTSVEAALEEPRRTWAVNADGTLNVLEKARVGETDRFIYVSSASVYGPPRYIPVDEDHPTEPVEPYGASKLAGEALARSYASSYALEANFVRLFNAYGPGQAQHNVIPTIISQAMNDDVIELGNLTPARDFVYIADVVDALRRVLAKGKDGTAYNVGRGESVSIGTVAEMVIEAVGRDIDLVSTADRQRSEDIEISNHVADVSRMEALGWDPEFCVREGIESTLESVSE